MMTLYDFALSGNAHRVRLLLSLLQLPHQRIALNLKQREQKQDWYLKLNPLGEVPVLVDDEVVLRDSTAILIYLAKKYDHSKQWLPNAPLAAAQVQQWLAIAGHEIANGPANARRAVVFGQNFDLAKCVEASHQLLRDLFEPHLTLHDWLVGEQPSIADIACYGYIKTAPEGQVSLESYPNVRAWLTRLEALENFEAMPAA